MNNILHHAGKPPWLDKLSCPITCIHNVTLIFPHVFQYTVTKHRLHISNPPKKPSNQHDPSTYVGPKAKSSRKIPFHGDRQADVATERYPAMPAMQSLIGGCGTTSRHCHHIQSC